MINSTTFLFSAEPGDVDESNEVDNVDALLVAQYYVGLNPPALNNVSVSDGKKNFTICHLYDILGRLKIRRVK